MQLTALLREAGWHVSFKRVERIWRRERLKVPQKQPKRGRLWLNDGSCILLRPEYPGHVCSYELGGKPVLGVSIFWTNEGELSVADVR
jgi:putative transposase